jgi:hypothetical protein
MEAVKSGVRLFPLSRDLPCEWVPRPKRLSKGALNWAFQQIGTQYPSNLSMIWRRLTGRKVEVEKMDCRDYFRSILLADEENIDPSGDADPVALRKIVRDKWGNGVITLLEE